MSTLGFDVSHYQSGLDVGSAKRQGYEFVIAKCTEGTGYADPAYDAFRKAAQANGMLFAAYHFLSHGNAAGQAALLAEHIGDKTIPVMLDVEANGATVADARDFRAACKRRGITVSLLYLPHWYWQRLGSPSLAGWRLVSSAYPSSAHAHGSKLYPGARGSGWAAYGGTKPVLWQFASTGKIDGYAGNVDLDAFEGSRAQLAALGVFKDYGHAKPAPKPPKPKPAPKPAPKRSSVDEQAAIDIERGVAPKDVKRPRVAKRLRQIIARLRAGAEK